MRRAEPGTGWQKTGAAQVSCNSGDRSWHFKALIRVNLRQIRKDHNSQVRREMHGTLDIRRNTNGTDKAPIYEVRYEDLCGNSFAGSMNPDDLHELLYNKLAMDVTD